MEPLHYLLIADAVIALVVLLWPRGRCVRRWRWSFLRSVARATLKATRRNSSLTGRPVRDRPERAVPIPAKREASGAFVCFGVQVDWLPPRVEPSAPTSTPQPDMVFASRENGKLLFATSPANPNRGLARTVGGHEGSGTGIHGGHPGRRRMGAYAGRPPRGGVLVGLEWARPAWG